MFLRQNLAAYVDKVLSNRAATLTMLCIGVLACFFTLLVHQAARRWAAAEGTRP